MKLTGTLLSLLLLSTLNANAEESKTTTTLQQVAPTQPKQWGLAYVQESRIGKQDLNEGTGKVMTFHWFPISYKFENGIKTSINPMWTSYTDTTGSGAATFIPSDLFLKVGKSKIALNHNWTVDLAMRYYVPTSDASRALGSNGRIRPEIAFERPLNDRFTFSYYGTYLGYLQNSPARLQTVEAAAKQHPSTRGKPTSIGDSGITFVPTANTRSIMINVFGLDYKMNKDWSFTQWVGYWDTRYFGDPSVGVSAYLEDSFIAWSYFSYTYSKNVEMQFGLEQQRGPKQRAADPSYSFMADNETTCYFHLGLSI